MTVPAAPLPTDDGRARVIAALERCHGNQTHAAKMLGVSRRTLITKMERYDLPRPRKTRGGADTERPSSEAIGDASEAAESDSS